MEEKINGIKTSKGNRGRDVIIPLWGVTADENTFCQRVEEGDSPIQIIRELFPAYNNPMDRKKNDWCRMTANRWLKNTRIVNRLESIREEKRKKSVVTQENMTNRLVDILDFDIGDLYKQNDNGDDILKPLSELTKEQRRMIKGFDRNGCPVLIDKEFAIKQIVKINGLESINVSVHIGGKLGELLGGGAVKQIPEKARIIQSNPDALKYGQIEAEEADIEVVEDAEAITEDDFSDL